MFKVSFFTLKFVTYKLVSSQNKKVWIQYNIFLVVFISIGTISENVPAIRDYQESVTTGQTDGQKDARQSDPYVPLCFAGDTTIREWHAIDKQ